MKRGKQKTVILRYLIRRSEDGFEAECIDAGATGLGETELDALQSLIESLEALHACATEQRKPMLCAPRPEDEQAFLQIISGGNPEDPELVGCGLLQRRRRTGRKTRPPGFAPVQHRLVAA